MFTGLIVEMGTVVAFRQKGAAAVLSVSAPLIGPSASVGDSVAINGVCLTVTTNEKGVLSFDLSPETLRSSNLGELRAGNRVNLEPALRADARLGGHFVTGHVDAVGKIKKIARSGGTINIEIECPEDIAGQLVPKGSVAVDGISLTVVDVLRRGFTLVIIPHTAQVTTLGFKEVGSTVNIETDIIGKYVFRYLGMVGNKDSKLMTKLKEEGFWTE